MLVRVRRASLVPVPLPTLANEVHSEEGNGNQKQEHFERAGSAVWRHAKQPFDEVHQALQPRTERRRNRVLGIAPDSTSSLVDGEGRMV